MFVAKVRSRSLIEYRMLFLEWFNKKNYLIMANLMKNKTNLFPKSFFYDDAFTRDWFDWVFSDETPKSSLPAVNIKETEKSFQLEMAAPGMNREDFRVELNNNRLTVSAEKKENKAQTNYSRKEFDYSFFKRSFNLPEKDIVRDKISAEYKDGILFLEIPKDTKAKANAVRMIEVA